MEKMLEMMMRTAGYDPAELRPRIEAVIAMAATWDLRIKNIDDKLNFIISEMSKPQVVTAVMHQEIPPNVNGTGSC